MFWSTNQNLQNPQSLNSYSYAENNPINKKDPLGLAATKAQQIKVLQLKINILQGIVNLYKSGNTKDANKALSTYNSTFGPKKEYISSGDKNKPAVYGPVQRPDITSSLNNKMQSDAFVQAFRGPWYFKGKVTNGGDWDLKNTEEYNSKNNSQGFTFRGRDIAPDAPGNIHYGYVGSAGIWSSPDLLLTKAGERQVTNGNSQPQYQNSNFHGDDPSDQINIVWGIDMYYNR